MGKLAVAVFVGVSIGASAVFDNVDNGPTWMAAWLSVVLASALAGYVLGRPAALALCIVPLLTAVPFGEFSIDAGDVWRWSAILQVVGTPFYAAALLLGVGLRRRHASESADDRPMSGRITGVLAGALALTLVAGVVSVLVARASESTECIGLFPSASAKLAVQEARDQGYDARLLRDFKRSTYASFQTGETGDDAVPLTVDFKKLLERHNGERGTPGGCYSDTVFN